MLALDDRARARSAVSCSIELGTDFRVLLCARTPVASIGRNSVVKMGDSVVSGAGFEEYVDMISMVFFILRARRNAVNRI